MFQFKYIVSLDGRRLAFQVLLESQLFHLGQFFDFGKYQFQAKEK